MSHLVIALSADDVNRVLRDQHIPLTCQSFENGRIKATLLGLPIIRFHGFHWVPEAGELRFGLDGFLGGPIAFLTYIFRGKIPNCLKHRDFHICFNPNQCLHKFLKDQLLNISEMVVTTEDHELRIRCTFQFLK